MTGNSEDKGWLDGKMEDPEFRRLYEREEAIEAFLNHVDQEMERQNLTRTELAHRMGCSPANVTQLMRRTANLTAATMVDFAFAMNQKVAFLLHPRTAEGFLRNLSGALLAGYEWAANSSEIALLGSTYKPVGMVAGPTGWVAPIKNFPETAESGPDVSIEERAA